jgi:Flp pilus assembly protein TadG
MRRNRGGNRGAASVLVLLALVTLIACLALSVDLGRVAVAKEQLQNIADASAEAAAVSLRGAGMNTTAGSTAAKQMAAASKVLGQTITLADSDITIGAWDPVAKVVNPWDVGTSGAPSNLGGYVAVQVRARLTSDSPNGALAATFCRIVGINTFNVTAIGIAGLTMQQMQRPPVEMTFLLDYSGSFANEFSYAVTALKDFSTNIQGVAQPGPQPGFGDKCAFFGFQDYAINSTNYPVAGWTDYVHHTGTWKVTNVNYNYSLGLTRMDNSDANTVINKFTNSNKIFAYATGSNGSELYYNGQKYGSSTNTADGLLKAAAMYKDSNNNWYNSAARHVITIVTDGMPFFYAPDGTKTATYSKAQTTAAADTLAAQGFVIHTVTLCQDTGGTTYGFSGSDADYDASLVRNGGYAFRTADPTQLESLIIGGVGSVEYGRPHLLK